MNKAKLSSVVRYKSDKLETSKISKSNYISTDNMNPNRGGVVEAKKIPNSKTVNRYVDNDILISNIRPYFKKIWLAVGEGGHSSDVLNFEVVNSQFDLKFVYYNLFSDAFFEHVMNGAKGSKMPRGDKKHILEFNIPFFPLSHQQKIASVLSALDDQIELNNKINQELEDLAQTLYNYWFVQFEFPNEEGKPYQSSGGKMIWNEELKREIPEGWEVDSFCENKHNSFSKEKVKDFTGVKKYIATGDVIGTTISSILEEISFKNRPSRANAQPMKNTVWFAKMTDSKKTLLLTENDTDLVEETIFSTGFCGISSSPEFLLYTWSFVNNNWFESKKDFLAHGATQQAVNEDDLRKIKMVIPSDVVVESFYKIISPTYLEISNNRKQNQELTQLRDYLLPLLMNGQVGFSDEDK